VTASAPPRPATAVPGPRGMPLLGSGPALVRDPLGTYRHAMETYGDIVRPVAGPPGRRVVLHALFAPEHARQVLAGSRGHTKQLPLYREIAAALGDGPRACIGGSFALLEAVLATALIVRAYRLTTPPDPIPLAAGITLRPATSVPCSLRR
jgi:hypothetical protein